MVLLCLTGLVSSVPTKNYWSWDHPKIKITRAAIINRKIDSFPPVISSPRNARGGTFSLIDRIDRGIKERNFEFDPELEPKRGIDKTKDRWAWNIKKGRKINEPLFSTNSENLNFINRPSSIADIINSSGEVDISELIGFPVVSIQDEDNKSVETRASLNLRPKRISIKKTVSTDRDQRDTRKNVEFTTLPLVDDTTGLFSKENYFLSSEIDPSVKIDALDVEDAFLISIGDRNLILIDAAKDESVRDRRNLNEDGCAVVIGGLVSINDNIWFRNYLPNIENLPKVV